jgi:hypothetical protein
MRRTGLLPRVLAPLAVSAAVVVALAGCVPAPAATPTPTSSAGAAPTIAKIDLNGTAAQNQAYFDLVNQKLIAAGGDLSGRPFIDNLVKAGYPKVNMEVTPDRTSVNLAADNIEFSIRFGQSCLIGQYGNTGYSSTVQKMLSTSRCLVGTTRPIDW